MTEPEFCPLCDVTLDLHDGPDSCSAADDKARLLEQFGRMRPNETIPPSYDREAHRG